MSAGLDSASGKTESSSIFLSARRQPMPPALVASFLIPATCFIKRPLSLVVAAAYLKVLQLRYILSSLNCSEIHVYHMCVSRLSSFINIDLSETPFIKDDSGHFNAIILHLILVIFHLFFS